MDNPYIMNPAIDHDNNEECDELFRCGDMVVGMAYVPMQAWKDVYDLPEALSRGTQFSELDKPFFGEDIWQ